MVKYLALLTKFCVIMFLNFLFQTPVQMQMNVPQVVDAGQVFEVTVTLSKGDVSGFSRYLQQLPHGLTATPVSNANADFSFKDQKLRLIWLRLPEDEESVSFTYNIHIDERLKGDFNLDGMFSFIENNERRSVDGQSTMITILPSPNLPPDQIVDIGVFENAVIQDLTPESTAKVICYRQRPRLTENLDGLTVNIIVNRNNQEKFAKIEETIPDGYDVMPLEKKGAIFSYKDNLVKFLWRVLPVDEYFNVSYKLVPQQGQPNPGIDISGEFSYIEDDVKTVTLDIIQEDFVLADKSSDGIKEVFERLSGSGQQIAATDQQQIDEGDEQEEQEEQDERPSLLSQKPDSEVSGKPEEKKPIQQKTTTKQTGGRSYMLTPEDGVYYRIQIAAGHKPVNVRRYFRKFNLEKNVKREVHEGWHKYSIGSFDEYKDARDYRNYIWRTTIIDDAFVAAYNDGNRITVQEALMIANQRWYK